MAFLIGKMMGCTFFAEKNVGTKTFFEAEKFSLLSTCSHNFCSLPKDGNILRGYNVKLFYVDILLGGFEIYL